MLEFFSVDGLPVCDANAYGFHRLRIELIEFVRERGIQAASQLSAAAREIVFKQLYELQDVLQRVVFEFIGPSRKVNKKARVLLGILIDQRPREITLAFEVIKERALGQLRAGQDFVKTCS